MLHRIKAGIAILRTYIPEATNECSLWSMVECHEHVGPFKTLTSASISHYLPLLVISERNKRAAFTITNDRNVKTTQIQKTKRNMPTRATLAEKGVHAIINLRISHLNSHLSTHNSPKPKIIPNPDTIDITPRAVDPAKNQGNSQAITYKLP